MSGILQNFAYGIAFSSAPVNTVAPVVSGTATVGQTLSSTTGTWTGVPTPTFTYQWQRTGSNIGGATSSTYVLVSADYANTIRCVVTATNVAGAVSANSNSTASVAGTAPVNTVAPVVSGTATFGSTLSCTTGTWTGTPAPTYTYAWYRAPSTPISGATSSTYTLVAGDVGFSIFCLVGATNIYGAPNIQSNQVGPVSATVPGAPTIGTATQTGSTTATVSYTAPASNGGATITTYTAYPSSGSGTGSLSTAGSGTISVTGLTASTSYTFTVKATNSVGQSAASAASNSITTATPLVPSQVAYTTPGTYTWVVPTGVTTVSVVVVGGGGTGGRGGATSDGCCPPTYFGWGGGGGAGGGLAYGNGLTTTPGASITVRVAATNKPCGPTTEYSAFNGGGYNITANSGGVSPPNGSIYNQATAGVGGTAGGTGYTAAFSGGNGGTGVVKASCRISRVSGFRVGGGAGGAAGYAGAGGSGSLGKSSAGGCAGAGGGGGGGTGGTNANTGGGGGGGVGIKGQGSSGAGGVYTSNPTLNATCGGAGFGGSSGANGGYSGIGTDGGPGGAYGGGSGGYGSNGCAPTFFGAGGAVRIIWPGNTRYFPSTCTGDK